MSVNPNSPRVRLRATRIRWLEEIELSIRHGARLRGGQHRLIVRQRRQFDARDRLQHRLGGRVVLVGGGHLGNRRRRTVIARPMVLGGEAAADQGAASGAAQPGKGAGSETHRNNPMMAGVVIVGRRIRSANSLREKSSRRRVDQDRCARRVRYNHSPHGGGGAGDSRRTCDLCASCQRRGLGWTPAMRGPPGGAKVKLCRRGKLHACCRQHRA